MGRHHTCFQEICVAIARPDCYFARFTALLLLVFALPISAPGGIPGRKFTVKDSIEATRVLYFPDSTLALLSPDHTRYLIVLYRGDLTRNGTWVELLSGGTASLKQACRYHKTRLFSRSAGRASDLVRNIRWLDDDRLMFLWDDGKKPSRVVTLNLRTGSMHTVVSRSTPIVAYDVTSDGRILAFVAESTRNKLRESMLERTGFVVTKQSLEALLNNNPDGWTPTSHYDTFAMSTSQRGKLRKVRESPALWSIPPELLRLSPDGRYAISVEPARTVFQSWNAYTEHIFKDDYLPGARRDPGAPNFIRQYYIIDVTHAVGRPLWTAPENPFGNVVWSPDSRQLAVGPTFLPVEDAGPNGLAGRAVGIFDLANGRFDALPLPEAVSKFMFQPVLWTENGVIRLTRVDQGHGTQTLDFKKIRGKWTCVGQNGHLHSSGDAVLIELRENPNSPPVIYAVEARTGLERIIKRLDPDLGSTVRLAHVQLVHWTALDGRPWSGMLYYPVRFVRGKSFPMVIQTHGYTLGKFSLNGAFPTAFAAQALANRDIAVLQLGGSDDGDADVLATPKEPRVFVSGVEGAIRHFVADGLADRSHIGIIGFSRTGWLVEYMLTHNDFPFCAAEVADNIDGSYVQYILGQDFLKSEYGADNGALPYGAGLQTWLRNAPGFNCDKIRAPLRIELDSGPMDRILGRWELFSNLRQLQKPVELFVVPDIQNAAHILGAPAQQFASENGTVDWFCFWLKNEEDPSASKSSQYARWHHLKMLEKETQSEQRTE